MTNEGDSLLKRKQDLHHFEQSMSVFKPTRPEEPPMTSKVTSIIELISRSESKLDEHEKVLELLEQLHQKIIVKEKTNGPGKKRMTMEKLAQITGRMDSLASLREYINPESSEEAKNMGIKIEQSDKMKKIFGKRPNSAMDPIRHRNTVL